MCIRDSNRTTLSKFKNFDEFNSGFKINENIYNQFISYAEKNGVKPDAEGMKTSDEIIRTQLKALIARQVWKNDGFYPVIQTLDNTLKKALELIDKKEVAIIGS